MGKFKITKNVIFIVIIAVLVCSLAVSSFFIIRKNGKYKQVSAELDLKIADEKASSASEKSKIDEYSSKITEYEAQIEQKSKEYDALQEQLNEAKKQKEALEKENADLKRQLLAKRQTQQAELKRLAILNSQQSPIPENAKICYLTFDDGPSDNTLKIIDILNSYGIKGTFFVKGTSKTQYIKNLCDAGHTVALHSYSHNYGTIYSSVEAYLADLNQISDIVQSITGQKSMLVRFPGGGSNTVSASYCKGIMSDLTVRLPSMGYSYFDWNVSSGDADANGVPPSKLISNVVNGARGKMSICVLMHDTNAKSTTVEALPSIITSLYDMGYSFAPLTVQTYGFHHAVNN